MTLENMGTSLSVLYIQVNKAILLTIMCKYFNSGSNYVEDGILTDVYFTRQ